MTFAPGTGSNGTVGLPTRDDVGPTDLLYRRHATRAISHVDIASVPT